MVQVIYTPDKTPTWLLMLLMLESNLDLPGKYFQNCCFAPAMHGGYPIKSADFILIAQVKLVLDRLYSLGCDQFQISSCLHVCLCAYVPTKVCIALHQHLMLLCTDLQQLATRHFQRVSDVVLVHMSTCIMQ